MDPEEDLAVSGAGLAISSRRKTSAEPYPACTIARIICRRDGGALRRRPGRASRPGRPRLLLPS